MSDRTPPRPPPPILEAVFNPPSVVNLGKVDYPAICTAVEKMLATGQRLQTLERAGLTRGTWADRRLELGQQLHDLRITLSQAGIAAPSSLGFGTPWFGSEKRLRAAHALLDLLRLQEAPPGRYEVDRREDNEDLIFRRVEEAKPGGIEVEVLIVLLAETAELLREAMVDETSPPVQPVAGEKTGVADKWTAQGACPARRGEGNAGGRRRDGPTPGNDNVLTFTAGGFLYRGHEEALPGKPLDVLKALYQAMRKTLTRSELLGRFWKDTPVENSTVGSAVSDARKALRRAMENAGRSPPPEAHKDYPIVTVNRGGGNGADDRTAWQLLELP